MLMDGWDFTLTLWTFRLISHFNGIHSDIFDLDLLGQAELIAQ